MLLFKMMKICPILKFYRNQKTAIIFLTNYSSLASISRFLMWDAQEQDRCLQISSSHSRSDKRKSNLLQQNYFSSSVSKNENLLENEKDIDPDSNPEPEISESERKNELFMAMKFLRSKGYTAADIKKKCAKYINTPSSYYKVLLLSELYSNILLLMPLMNLNLASLKVAAKQARDDKNEINGFPNRIAYLTHHLEVSPEDLVTDLAKHSSLLTMQFYRLQHKMDILKDARINPENIAKDLWIFNYNEKLLETRIAAAQKAGVELKPWMLRCSEKIFKAVLTKNSETQRVLKGQDEISYLAMKLDCSREYVSYIMERNKLLKTINIPKLERVLDFLYEKGYTPQEVRLFPRVFCSSVQTLNEKFLEFQKLKSTLPTVSQLCISTKKLQSKINKKSS